MVLLHAGCLANALIFFLRATSLGTANIFQQKAVAQWLARENAGNSSRHRGRVHPVAAIDHCAQIEVASAGSVVVEEAILRVSLSTR